LQEELPSETVFSSSSSSTAAAAGTGAGAGTGSSFTSTMGSIGATGTSFFLLRGF